MDKLRAKEAELEADLAKTTEAHFPELLLMNSELGLANELEYRGLVKLGRSLDQFDLKPLCADKPSVKASQFHEEPVVIKVSFSIPFLLCHCSIIKLDRSLRLWSIIKVLLVGIGAYKISLCSTY